eukprot:9381781-Pyramimonas_sp.AAC.1
MDAEWAGEGSARKAWCTLGRAGGAHWGCARWRRTPGKFTLERPGGARSEGSVVRARDGAHWCTLTRRPRTN